MMRYSHSVGPLSRSDLPYIESSELLASYFSTTCIALFDTLFLLSFIMSGTGFAPQQPQVGPVSYEDWAKSDAYHISHLIPEDPILEAAKKNSHDKGLPDIAVSTSQGKFLHLTAKAIGAKRILEVGTLGGYAAIEIVFHSVQLTNKPLYLDILQFGWPELCRTAGNSSPLRYQRSMHRYITYELPDVAY